MSDELPAAAIEAGAEGLLDSDVAEGWMLDRFRDVQRPNAEKSARAVLVAATERIECPANTEWYSYPEQEPVHHHKCACAGSGFLYVLKQEKT